MNHKKYINKDVISFYLTIIVYSIIMSIIISINNTEYDVVYGSTKTFTSDSVKIDVPWLVEYVGEYTPEKNKKFENEIKILMDEYIDSLMKNIEYDSKYNFIKDGLKITDTSKEGTRITINYYKTNKN